MEGAKLDTWGPGVLEKSYVDVPMEVGRMYEHCMPYVIVHQKTFMVEKI